MPESSEKDFSLYMRYYYEMAEVAEQAAVEFVIESGTHPNRAALLLTKLMASIMGHFVQLLPTMTLKEIQEISQFAYEVGREAGAMSEAQQQALSVPVPSPDKKTWN